MLSQIPMCTILIHKVMLVAFNAAAKEADQVRMSNPREAFHFPRERVGFVVLVDVLDCHILAARQHASVDLASTASSQALLFVLKVDGVLNFCLGEPVEPRPHGDYLWLNRSPFKRLLLGHVLYHHYNQP